MADPYDELYPFQQTGVDYLVDHGGGFLWDDPGLGKTRQAIIAAKQLGGPILVVCPNSVKRWWRTEIRNMYPESSVVIAGQGGRFGRKSKQSLPNPVPFWVIIHYTGLRLNHKQLGRIPWGTIILDECHYIKNRKAGRTKAALYITNEYTYKIGLTATPWGNNPSDLWSQLRWMAPHVKGLRSFWKFYEMFVEYEFEKRGTQRYRKPKGGRNLQLLARVMAGYGLRRSKRVVAPQLPPITDTHIPLAMAPEGKQDTVYRQLKRKSVVELTIEPSGPAEPAADGAEPTEPVRLLMVNALARLMRMEQWLSHPWTFDAGVRGAKLEWLLQWAEGYNEQAVIATRFKASAKYIAQLLNAQTWTTERGAGVAAAHRLRSGPSAVTGDISVGARDRIIEQWKAGKYQFIVGTIDTIGIGLSFEQAHALVCYDQLYSSIKMQQVRERVHRITTDHPVQVLYPHIEGTTNDVVLKSFLNNWKQAELVRAYLEHLQAEESNGLE